MSDQSLSPRAHGWLSDIHHKLRRQSSVERRTNTAVADEFIAWCDQHGVDLERHRRHQELRFDRELIARLQALLEDLGHLPLGATTKGKTSAEQATLSHLEDKASGARPRTHRVLLNMASAGARSGIAPYGREMVDADWRDLDLSAFDVLLMIENLDSFYATTPDHPALAGYQQPLLVYRGDALYSAGFRQLAGAWQATGKSHLAIGDFDAKGLEIILGSGASQLWVPPLEWLRAHATADHLPAKQWDSQQFLRRYRERLPAEHPLLGYLALLLDEQRGLKQQWFGDPLIRVNLRLTLPVMERASQYE